MEETLTLYKEGIERTLFSKGIIDSGSRRLISFIQKFMVVTFFYFFKYSDLMVPATDFVL